MNQFKWYQIYNLLTFVFLLGRQACSEGVVPGEEREQQWKRKILVLHWKNQGNSGKDIDMALYNYCILSAISNNINCYVIYAQERINLANSISLISVGLLRSGQALDSGTA